METAARNRVIWLARAAGGTLALAAAACANPVPDPVEYAEIEVIETAPESQPPVAEPVLEPVPEAAPPAPPVLTLACQSEATQGGAILCRTAPHASVQLDGTAVARADDDGWAFIGLSRSQKTPARLSVTDMVGQAPPLAEQSASAEVHVKKRFDSVSRFPMDCDRIAAQTPEQKRHAEISWVKKDRALKAFNAPLAPIGFVKPADGPYSSPFGVTRTYVPKTKDCSGSTSVHNGQDIAIPTGTEIHAPMAGTVLLADPDLYYEGGAVFLDHGRGVMSVTMHMSRIDVADGQQIQQGELLGLSGATGRVTGPHLHWAIKFRNVHSDDRGTDIWLDPSLIVALDQASIVQAGQASP